MPDTPPDRLSNDPRSRFHDAALLERGIGIRFNGEERNNVEEYCVSEGWIRTAVGAAAAVHAAARQHVSRAIRRPPGPRPGR
jgi:hypothetical protein